MLTWSTHQFLSQNQWAPAPRGLKVNAISSQAGIGGVFKPLTYAILMKGQNRLLEKRLQVMHDRHRHFHLSDDVRRRCSTFCIHVNLQRLLNSRDMGRTRHYIIIVQEGDWDFDYTGLLCLFSWSKLLVALRLSQTGQAHSAHGGLGVLGGRCAVADCFSGCHNRNWCSCRPT
jgi:hypothetical protein